MVKNRIHAFGMHIAQNVHMTLLNLNCVGFALAVRNFFKRTVDVLIVWAVVVATLPNAHGAPPLITRPPSGMVIDPNNPFTFNVVAIDSNNPSKPIKSYQWFKDRNIQIPGAIGSTYTIPRVTKADAGDYYVQVTASTGEVSTSNLATLSVNSPPVILSVTPASPVLLKSGDSLNLNATFTGTLPVTYRWYKNGQPICSPLSCTQIRQTATFTISPAGPDADGEYWVEVSNSVNRSAPLRSSSVWVKTQGTAPVVSPLSLVPSPLTVNGSATLQATVTSRSTFKVVWKKTSGGVTSQLQNFIYIGSATPQLVALPLTAADDTTEGTYILEVDNGYPPSGVASKSVTVVFDTPKFLSLGLSSAGKTINLRPFLNGSGPTLTTLAAGETLSVTVKAGAPISYKWEYVPFGGSSGVTLRNAQSLIMGASPQPGQYVCTATAGGKSTVLKVSVLGNSSGNTVTRKNFSSFSTADGATFAVGVDGRLFAWGNNADGQLGLPGSPVWVTSPTQVGADSDWIGVSTSMYTTFGLKKNGNLYAWGIVGALNQGTSTYVMYAGVPDTGFRNKVTRGDPKDPAYEVGDVVIATVPQLVGSGWSAVYSGGLSTNAIKSNGEMYFIGWGGVSNPETGDVWNWSAVDLPLLSQSKGNDGSVAFYAPKPVPIKSAAGWSTAGVCSSGFLLSYGINKTGRVYTWGVAGIGLGAGSAGSLPANLSLTGANLGKAAKYFLGYTAQQHLPEFVYLFLDAVQIGAESNWWYLNSSIDYDFFNANEDWKQRHVDNGFSNYAIDADGALFSWGYNLNKRLGTSATTQKDYLSKPTQLAPGLPCIWTAVSSYDYWAFGVQADGKMYGWGYNGTPTYTPNRLLVDDAAPHQDWIVSPKLVKMPAGSPCTNDDWLDVRVFMRSVYALKRDGTIWAWGDNSNGQLGIGITSNSWIAAPTQVSGYYLK